MNFGMIFPGSRDAGVVSSFSWQDNVPGATNPCISVPAVGKNFSTGETGHCDYRPGRLS